MKKYLQDYIIAELIDLENKRLVIAGVGFVTFFFGFAAGALFNVYLLWIGSPLVTQLRSSLTYKSAIFGDGILLPVITMIVMAFLLKNWSLLKRHIVYMALFLGLCITAYFHVVQAMGGIVNWAMPTPWHWNFLGVWHACYMFSVSSFLSLFYLVLIQIMKKQKRVPAEVFIVTIGIVVFFVLLRFDYMTINLHSLLPY